MNGHKQSCMLPFSDTRKRKADWTQSNKKEQNYKDKDGKKEINKNRTSIYYLKILSHRYKQ
jgi:hypothetical protein